MNERPINAWQTKRTLRQRLRTERERNRQVSLALQDTLEAIDGYIYDPSDQQRIATNTLILHTYGRFS